jgi:hypothetical protein
VSLKTVFSVFEEIAPKNKRDLIEINKNALVEGSNLVKRNQPNEPLPVRQAGK